LPGTPPTADDGSALRRLGRAGLPVAALVVFAGAAAFTLIAAGTTGTLGYDFLAYHQAANRLLDGQPLYDPTIQQTGGFGLFYYPPPFALAIVPFAPLSGATAAWLWAGLSIVAFLVGTAILPVRRDIRWLIVLLAALMWPFAYALKLGQVGPVLYLLFAIGWRRMDDPVSVGATAAFGALIKVQPGIILAWTFLTRRWAAVIVGVAILLLAAVLATAVAGGLDVWTSFVTILGNVSDPITTPHNFTPGAIAYQLGLPVGPAAILQVASTIGAAAIVVVTALRATAAASYLVAVVASQLLSPVLWDHYAMLLLLPVAWLLDRGHWWAAIVPLVSSILTIGLTPPIVYPVLFWITLVAVATLGLRDAAASSAAVGAHARAGSISGSGSTA
jgi:Glycosyltransferase family 87